MDSLSSEKLARVFALYGTDEASLFNHQPLGYFLINYSLLQQLLLMKENWGISKNQFATQMVPLLILMLNVSLAISA